MIKNKRMSLSTQINLIFTLITFVTSVLFIIIFRQTVHSFTNAQANKDFQYYHENLAKVIDESDESKFPSNSYYLYAYYESDNNFDQFEIVKQNDKTYLGLSKIATIVKDYFEGNTTKGSNSLEILTYDKYTYIITYKKDVSDNSKYNVLITVSDGKYAQALREPISNIISIGFVSIIVLGNAIILLWSSVTVERIKKLEQEVAELGTNDYKKKINIEGKDEIADLARAIDQMREEILNNESVKQEMLQNISHDIKTPIAVIQSYAEAIQDGITDISEVDTIIRQADILNRKVKQLLEWNKLEYIKSSKDFYEVNMKEVIETVVNNNKYKSDIDFILNLDDSTFTGITDNYYSVVSNIVENGLRYAKKVIKITLKNKKLTIFNDGEKISDNFINEVFKPYEKGHKGQFGLGMTIVQRTVNHFGLKLTIENNDNGVSFIIEPRK
ncbi:MAG: HAMP domain-containing sensor histidine kinase [Acholeplasma sp.]|nr:HAMP domain-containing sensor histidine kinase [Acholeplasma sp.]